MSGEKHVQTVRTALIVGLLVLQDGREAGCSVGTWILAVGGLKFDLTSLAPADIPGVIRLLLQLSVTFQFAYSDGFNPK